MARATFASLYPTLAELVECGMQIDVNGGGYHLKIASLYDESGMICQFSSAGMSADAIFKKLEKLAVRFEEEGIATDEVNGTEHSVR
jgi:hypothetical protein